MKQMNNKLLRQEDKEFNERDGSDPSADKKSGLSKLRWAWTKQFGFIPEIRVQLNITQLEFQIEISGKHRYESIFERG